MDVVDAIALTVIIGGGAYLFLHQGAAATAPVSAAAPARSSPGTGGSFVQTSSNIGAGIGAAFGSATGPLAPIARPVAAATGGNIAGGLAQTFKGDKEIITGHPWQGLKDVGSGYYTAGFKTFVGGVKSAWNAIF